MDINYSAPFTKQMLSGDSQMNQTTEFNLKEALRLLDWAAKDFEKNKISNDNWYAEYQDFLHYDIENINPIAGNRITGYDIPTGDLLKFEPKGYLAINSETGRNTFIPFDNQAAKPVVPNKEMIERMVAVLKGAWLLADQIRMNATTEFQIVQIKEIHRTIGNVLTAYEAAIRERGI